METKGNSKQELRVSFSPLSRDRQGAERWPTLQSSRGCCPPRQEPSPAEDKRWAIKLARESRRGEEALQAGARNAI